MKIKRFNENQHYLTTPYDPEFGLTIDINVKTWWKEFENHLKVIAKELGDYHVNEVNDNYNLILEIYGGDKVNPPLDCIEFKINISVSSNCIYIEAVVNRDEDDDRNFECGGVNYNMNGLKEQILELLYQSGLKEEYEDED